jgi:electron transport complex protein RnfE
MAPRLVRARGFQVVISLLRNFIPDKIRIPSFIIVICTFVTMVQMFMNAFLPALYQSLGIFLPLIVVTASFWRARKRSPARTRSCTARWTASAWASIHRCADADRSIRELLGNVTLFGQTVFGSGYQPMLLLILPAGGFIVFGLLLAIFNTVSMRADKRKRRRANDPSSRYSYSCSLCADE